MHQKPANPFFTCRVHSAITDDAIAPQWAYLLANLGSPEPQYLGDTTLSILRNAAALVDEFDSQAGPRLQELELTIEDLFANVAKYDPSLWDKAAWGLAGSRIYQHENPTTKEILDTYTLVVDELTPLFDLDAYLGKK